jgi:hypothetical protein
VRVTVSSKKKKEKGRNSMSRINSAWYRRYCFYYNEVHVKLALLKRKRERLQSPGLFDISCNCRWSVTVSVFRLEPAKARARTKNWSQMRSYCTYMTSDTVASIVWCFWYCTCTDIWSSALQARLRALSPRSGDQWGTQILLQSGTILVEHLFCWKIYITISFHDEGHRWILIGCTRLLNPHLLHEPSV